MTTTRTKPPRAPWGVVAFFVIAGALISYVIGRILVATVGMGLWWLHAILGLAIAFTATRYADRWWRKRIAKVQPPPDGSHDRISI